MENSFMFELLNGMFLFIFVLVPLILAPVLWLYAIVVYSHLAIDDMFENDKDKKIGNNCKSSD